MPRQTPDDLADEIRAEGGRWSLNDARFRPTGARGARRSFDVSIAVSGGATWSDVALDSRPAREARNAVDALKRSGYEILSIRAQPFLARRPLRGLGELDAEVRRLEALSRDPGALRSFPSRVRRQPGLPAGSGPFSTDEFDRLRDGHRWALEWVSAGRKGRAAFVEAPAWSTGAWCWLLDDGDERRLELHVQLFRKQPNEAAVDKEFAHFTRAFRDRLGPLGYTAVKLRGAKMPLFAVFDKGVRTLTEARRERERLNRILFGDEP